MSLLDEINATNESQIVAIEDCMVRLTAGYKAELAELRAARSILVGRRKRLGRELANGQAELPFEPASAVADHLAEIEREAEGEDTLEERLTREAGGAPPPGFDTSRGIEPRARRRKGAEGG